MLLGMHAMSEQTDNQIPMEDRWLSDEGLLFKKSMESISKGNFLGDLSTVDAILRLYVSNVADYLQGGKTKDQNNKFLMKSAGRLADIFLGKKKEYESVQFWNRPGSIDRFLAHWLGLAESDPRERMIHVGLKLIDEVMDIAVYASDDETDDAQSKWQLDEVIGRYARLLIGMSPPEQLSMVLSENKPEEPTRE